MEKLINVDQFIENTVADARSILMELRVMIKDSFVEVEEKIGYGVPQYKYKGSGIGLSVAKKHVTIGFDYGIITEQIRKELEIGGYKLGLQTLQIRFNQTIPQNEIMQIFNEIKKINE